MFYDKAPSEDSTELPSTAQRDRDLVGTISGFLLITLSPGAGVAAAALSRAYDEEAGNGAAGGWFRREAVAMAAGAASVALAALFVAGDEAVPAAILGWTLLALALVDLRHGILPDLLTLPLLALGLALAAARGGLPVDEALGAAAGYSAFAAVAALYRRLRRREGLGLGDAKLLAAGGAWLGWAALPAVVAAAALSALGLVALEAARGRPPATDREIRFGPFLCLAVWAVFLYRAAGFL